MAAVRRQDGDRYDQSQGAWSRSLAAAQIQSDEDLNLARGGGDGEKKKTRKAPCVAGICSGGRGRRAGLGDKEGKPPLAPHRPLQ